MILHTLLAVVLLKIAYLATAVAFVFVGKSLLEKGITGGFVGEGEIASKKFRLITSSPGLVFLLAGLTIVVTAIIRQSEVPMALLPSASPSQASQPAPPEVGGAQSQKEQATRAGAPQVPSQPAEPQDGKPHVARYAALATAKLLGSSEDQASAQALEDSAHQRIEAGDRAAAMDELARAVTLDPARLDRIYQDERLKPIVNDAQFVAFANARAELAIAAHSEDPLSPDARKIIAQLQIVSLRAKAEEPDPATRGELAAFPARADVEPRDRTKQRLSALLQKNPRATVELLRTPERRWVFADRELMEWLRSIAERAISGKVAP